MTSALFVTIVAVALGLTMVAGFKLFPGEHWQILAALPVTKTTAGRWTGVNLTYYGVFVATAQTLAVAVITILLGAVAVPSETVLILIAVVLCLCIPSTRVIARVVDRSRYNFTVAGGVAAGMAALPAAIAVIHFAGCPVSTAAVFTATATGYALGEAVGRLACISFGCCYGKALTQAPRWTSVVFRRFHFVFRGPTKKIAYESGLESVPVVPIQAITCCVHLAVGLISMLMFLEGHIIPAFALSFLACQAWRIYSETLRADYRGEGSISKYQVMAAIGIVYGIAISALLTEPGLHPDLSAGLHALWQPFVILSLEAIWCATFLYFGRSKVTGSEILIYVKGRG